MTKRNDQQLDSALSAWHQQQGGMPATLRRQIQHKLAAPTSSLWQRRWREAVALVSCSFVAAIWWQLAQAPELTYQIVRTEQAGRLIEIHQLSQLRQADTMPSVESPQIQDRALTRQLAFEQQYQSFRQQAKELASHHRLMRMSVQGDDVLLTDCQSQQIVVSKQLWQEWAKEQDLTPSQFRYLDVSQGAQGQIIALKFAAQGRNCTAP